MGNVRYVWGFLLAALSSLALAQSAPVAVNPPPHTLPWPMLGRGATDGMKVASYALGPELRRGESAKEMLAERRRLDAALDAIAPQRKGMVDAYVISVALDSDAVFAREAREAGRVLSTRYGAQGRTLVLAGPDARTAALPRGSIGALTVALARVAEIVDPAEDVLVVYLTSHGAPEGLAYHEGDTGYGILSPYRLRSVLAELGFQRRVLIVSACYSGVFVPYLAGPDTAILTAASASTTSFGCAAENDWTFFGDALINHALRKPQPQVSMGANVAAWLAPLDARTPKSANAPVGCPAFDPTQF